MLKKIGKIALVFLILFLIAGIAGIFIGNSMIDSKMNAVLSKIEHKVSGLKLQNASKKSGLLSRSGILVWEYSSDKLAPLGVKKITGATEYNIGVGLFSVNADFKNMEGEGNLNDILRSFSITPISYEGKASASLLSMSAKFLLKTSEATATLPDGYCSIGENSVSVKSSGFSSADIEIGNAAVKCQGTDTFNGKPSYVLDVENFKIKASPKFSDGNIILNSAGIMLKSLNGEASSLYLIGFSPKDQVKDPTLREALKASDIDMTISLEDKDSQNRYELAGEGRGSIAYAFPYIRAGHEQPFYPFDNIKFEASLERINPMVISKLAKADSKEIPALVLSALSNPLVFKLGRFSFDHQGESFSSSGTFSTNVDKQTMKPVNMKADVKLSGGRRFTQGIMGSDYQEALDDAVMNGSVSFDGKNYSTHAVFAGNKLTMNGVALNFNK